MQLLQNQSAQRDVQVFAGTPEIIPKTGRQFFDRQVPEQVVAEHARPTLFQQPPSLRSKIFPRIEQIAALMVTYG